MSKNKQLTKRRRIAVPLPVDRKTVKSAVRVLEILQFFDDMQRELTVMDIVKNLGYPQSSTTELLQSLVSVGFLECNLKARTYKPSVRVSLLGRWINSDCLANGPTLTLLDELSKKTGETIVLAMRNGLFSQYIHVIQATNPARLHMAIGSVRPLAQSGSGYALLAPLPDEEIKRIVIQVNAYARPDEERVDRKTLFEKLTEVRENGYAFTYDLVSRGAAVIAAPLPRTENFPAMVVGIGGISDVLRAKEKELSQILLQEIHNHMKIHSL